MVVICVDFQEEVILTCGVVTLYNLWNLAQSLNNIIEFLWVFKVQSDESTGLITNTFWVDNKLRTLYNTKVC